MAEGRLQWHPAFSAAFHIELNDELENLHIEEEHMLSKKPLQIDMLIIKKKKYKAYYQSDRACELGIDKGGERDVRGVERTIRR